MGGDRYRSPRALQNRFQNDSISGGGGGALKRGFYQNQISDAFLYFIKKTMEAEIVATNVPICVELVL